MKKTINKKEDISINPLYNFDNNLREQYKVDYIAGFDEAGRGPLCGPVFCAGVLLNKNFFNEKINDSKQLNEKLRFSLKELIESNAIVYKVISIDAETIDKINILESSRLGMQLCFDYIEGNFSEDFIVCTDYMKIKTNNHTLLSLAKGDATSFAIACASILAKTHRDLYMIELDKKYPMYDFVHNKGYGTKKHIQAINQYGLIDKEHRKTFNKVSKTDFLQEKLPIF